MRTTQATNDEMLRILAPMNSPMDVGINVLMMAILPAFGEELLFRGVLQRQFHKIVGNPHMAIMLTAIIFSAIHLQFLGFFSRAILGMLFGYLFYFSRNIWLPIIAHFINNFLALMLILLYGIDSMETSMENWVTGPFVLFSITSIAAAAFMVYSYRNSFQSTEV
jgi:membrane protease YdiL (CAAX protease family)